MITVKADVRFGRFTTGLIWAISRLDLLSKISRYCPEEIMITSANDGTHLEKSKHYIDEAIDIRSHNFTNGTKIAFREELEKFLNIGSPCQFTVLLESLGTANEHFHIQVKKGSRCP
jgi:hypothetical protein